MTVAVRELASGPGWRVSDFACQAGPRDRPYEEQHGSMCIALVTAGTFRYRSSQGTALLAPGAMLLGNRGACYECGHEHAAGDRCLSFHYTPDLLEHLLKDAPGVRRLEFTAPRVAPSLRLAGLAADLEAARELGDAIELQELAARLAGAVATVLAGAWPRAPSDSELRRVTAALRRIEGRDASEELSLEDLAEEAGFSPYHFLRVFRQAAGMTPYQYVLRTRLHRAAVRLRTTRDRVSAIAYDCGFNDLSTFNRRFRRVLGMTPQAYRRQPV